jgi:hypothetical protein
MYRLIISGANQVEMQRVEKPLEPQMDQLSSYYPEEGHMYPFCVDLKRKMMALAQKNGDILFWETFEQALA